MAQGPRSWRSLAIVLLPTVAGILWLQRPSTHPERIFNVEAVVSQGLHITNRSWEYGTFAEAMLELYDPDLSVFGSDPFPNGKIPVIRDSSQVRAVEYVRPLIWVNDSDLLIGGEGSPADPASLGVPTLLLSEPAYAEAAQRQAKYLLETATRFKINATHSAISHRDGPPELWGDFVYMVPPFLAYHGVASQDVTFLVEAVRQCQLYNLTLGTSITLPDGSQCYGLWRHIVSQPEQLPSGTCCSDPDVWLTSNAWAVAGMSRVLATILKWHPPDQNGVGDKSFEAFAHTASEQLTGILRQMLDCIISQPHEPESKLVRNHLDGEHHASRNYAFGDAAGTALVTSAVYRLAVLVPEIFAKSNYLDWANANLDAVASHLDTNGKVSPVASVDGVPSTRPADQTSEGQSMAILLYCAWRDWAKATQWSILGWSGSTGRPLRPVSYLYRLAKQRVVYHERNIGFV